MTVATLHPHPALQCGPRHLGQPQDSGDGLGIADAAFPVAVLRAPLPGADGVFDAVTVGFGVRNLVHLERGLTEMFRVLKRAGKLVILEFSVPKTRWIRDLYERYSFRIMPRAGKAITGASAPFEYLAESIRVFPTPERVKAMLEESGFRRVTIQRLTDGIAVVYLATKG